MRRNGRVPIALTSALLAVAAACETSPADRILSIEASGGARVFVFLDRDDNGAFGFGVDSRLINQAVVFHRVTGAGAEFSALTDTAGVALAAPLGVGRYQALIPETVLSDSIEMFSGGAHFTVAEQDTVAFTIGLRFRSLTPAEARALPIGAKGWVKGVVLNSRATFGDNSIHVRDDGAAIRLSQVPATDAVAGDTARFFGTRAARDGQPTFDIQRVVVELRFLSAPEPDIVTTTIAANARTGDLDAALVHVDNAIVTDTSRTANGNRILTVNDGSGPLDVELVGSLGFAPPPAYDPGSSLDVTGVLVPSQTMGATWLLRPRGAFDIPAPASPSTR